MNPLFLIKSDIIYFDIISFKDLDAKDGMNKGSSLIVKEDPDDKLLEENASGKIYPDISSVQEKMREEPVYNEVHIFPF